MGLNESSYLLIAVPSFGIFYFEWTIVSLYYRYIIKWDSVSFHMAAAYQGSRTEFNLTHTGGIVCIKICLIEELND